MAHTGTRNSPAALAVVALAGAGLVLLSAPAGAKGEKALAQASQNPVADLISVPFENNLDFNVGPEDGNVYVLNVKPVYPVNLGELKLLNRFILPLAYQQERFAGEGSETGLGNLNYQAFFSPAKPGRVIWGAGPAFGLPTNTDQRLGADKWSAGPALVVLNKSGPWLVGSLWQHQWSFAGDSGENNVNFSSWQYFINYNFDSGWYLSSTPTMTANWDADSGDRFTVPVGGGAGRVVRFGKLPVDMKLQGFYNAEKPDGAATWSVQLQFKLLFPKDKK
jgi:hypothetical protein